MDNKCNGIILILIIVVDLSLNDPTFLFSSSKRHTSLHMTQSVFAFAKNGPSTCRSADAD